jgi:heme oxygenase
MSTTQLPPTSVDDGVMARLRSSTWPQHQRAESRPLEQSLVRGTLPRDQYVAYLAQRWLIHCALERALLELRRARPDLAAVIDEKLFQQRQLEADLAHFGVELAAIAPLAATRKLCDEIDRLSAANSVALLGMYYVFEGSKNGARYIARALRGAYSLTDGNGLRYLDPHGEAQRALWQDFKARMDAIPFTDPETEAMIAAARLTFDCVSELDDEMHQQA